MSAHGVLLRLRAIKCDGLRRRTCCSGENPLPPNHASDVPNACMLAQAVA